MNNQLQVEIIRDYLIEEKLDFSRKNIIRWIDIYADKFRDIINNGINDKILIKKQLYGKN